MPLCHGDTGHWRGMTRAVSTTWMTSLSAPPLGLLLLAILITSLATGCDREEEIRTYTVAKPQTDPAATATVHGPGDGHDHGAQALPEAEIAWAVPEGWRRVPGDRPMRVATFEAGDDVPVEVVVSVFPGDTGGLLANVNRWRGQVGLGPITEAALSSEVEAFASDGIQGHTMRLRGEQIHLLGAAVFEPEADRTWFVKAIAPPSVADALEPQVNAFARSFRRRVREAGGAVPEERP